jgi:broad specificity phosphatase PhoE
MATELLLIRHGNAVRVNGDYFHAPLTQLGREQAAQTGEFLNSPQNHIDCFYSSPLRRAVETARIIGEKIGKKAETRKGIQEVRFFEVPALVFLELLSITDFVEDYLDARVGMPIRWPVEKRVSKVLLDILKKHTGERIAVVAHAGVISATLSWYLPEKRWRWWRTTVSNCSITRFKIEGNKAVLIEVNDIKHLSPVLISTQPASIPVEIAKDVHPVEKALVFDKINVPKK